jgi:hypothetical protein
MAAYNSLLNICWKLTGLPERTEKNLLLHYSASAADELLLPTPVEDEDR